MCMPFAHAADTAIHRRLQHNDISCTTAPLLHLQTEDSDSESSGDELTTYTNRDGTQSSATAAELKLAAQLSKDPWGRFGGRAGKMARIRAQEAEIFAAMQVPECMQCKICLHATHLRCLGVCSVISPFMQQCSGAWVHAAHDLPSCNNIQD